jgi:hypothetical protein
VKVAGPVESEVPDGGLEPALPEHAGAGEVPDRQVTVHRRAGGKFDEHGDGPGLLREVERAALRTAHGQRAVGVLDAGLLRGLDIGLVGLVARPYVDDGVAAVARDEPDVAGGQIDRDGNRFRGGENGHGCPSR